MMENEIRNSSILELQKNCESEFLKVDTEYIEYGNNQNQHLDQKKFFKIIHERLKRLEKA